jgi:hypothetical protein
MALHSKEQDPPAHAARQIRKDMDFNNISKTVFALFASVMLFAGILSPALAHETDCPYCKLPVIQDTKEIDNEVVLRFGNKRIEYRCVMCAMAHAKKRTGDLTILAPSNVKGKPVVINRKDGKWSSEPGTALFVFEKGSHSECQDRYRAVANKAEFDKYVAGKGAMLKDAKPITLAELVERSK